MSRVNSTESVSAAAGALPDAITVDINMHSSRGCKHGEFEWERDMTCSLAEQALVAHSLSVHRAAEAKRVCESAQSRGVSL